MRWIRALLISLGLVFATTAAKETEEGGAAAVGAHLYVKFCASCHGETGDGKGPVAPHMSKPPTDLRTLCERYGSPLVHGELAETIDGRKDVAGHGIKNMPVWGERLDAYIPQMPGSEAAKATTIEFIIGHLDEIQQH
jgi:mono/diheme cytochrome c family protein